MSGPPYKNHQNQWYTATLFYEMWVDLLVQNRVYDPVFSLFEDRPGLINARKTFVELGDPTGYKWAIQYLGDYRHWQRLIKTKWFQEAVAAWTAELEVKQQSEAIQKLREVASGETSQAVVAAKYLATAEYKKAPRGRPSKSEVAAEAKKMAEEDEDAKRIGLQVINGGKHS